METYDAVIVGTGFGGMGAAIQLRRLGFEGPEAFVMLEREDDLGGTWHVNHYPGLAVDIPSSTYSYSFEPNPHWSRLFAPGTELKAYAEHVADRYGLRPHMRFGQRVSGAVWDEDLERWHVTTTDGSVFSGRYLFTATGFLSQPKLPEIEGIETYQGRVLHTAAWDDAADLTGERVAVVGTGATAVQLVPEIAKVAEHLTVFQRTPIWVAPKVDYPVPAAVRKVFATVPLTQRLVRWGGSAMLEALMVGGVLHYKNLSLFNRAAEAMCRAHLARQVRDPELRGKLTPSYSFGCKRPTFSNDYFSTLAKDHVTLETSSIERVDESGLVTADGKHHRVDTLVLATGFNLWDVNFPAFEILGRDGRNLGKWWRDNRFQAYEGVTVPGFPNLVSLNSPYSYSGLSYFTTIESQMKHVERLFTGMRERGATVFEVTQEANDVFLERMTERVADTVFALGSCEGAHSYYFNQHGEATLLRPTSTLNALREASRFPLEDYAFTG